MDLIPFLIDLFLHLDKHLGTILDQYGTLTYAILFLVIFCETGLVVTPFLPGDSLLFAAGALSIGGTGLNVIVVWILLTIAAILGDTANYWIGYRIGKRAYTGEVKFIKKEYMERTHAFFEKYGGKTIFLARFVPIVRTFAPFVAGVGEMTYGHFITYNVVGGIVWTTLFVWGGYLLSEWLLATGIPFSVITLAIIGISVLPIFYEFIKARLERRGAQKPG